MTVRGPTARRGLQFRATPRHELLQRQEEARERLRLLDWLNRSPSATRPELEEQDIEKLRAAYCRLAEEARRGLDHGRSDSDVPNMTELTANGTAPRQARRR
jgi:hypothetical protein